MNLHLNEELFNDLITLTSISRGIPNDAVKLDYYIVLALQNLEGSEYVEKCVFKGGTSLSKCYPGSINRFSEDIDLTFIPNESLNDKQYSQEIKKVEKIMAGGLIIQKIGKERNDRNKICFLLFKEDGLKTTKIKLEIGSSVRPDPYEKKEVKTYIQEYLEKEHLGKVISDFNFSPVTINVLKIERTFIDKIFAVKRHAICGTLENKVRHIYDVTMMLDLPEIQGFISNREDLKVLVRKTKETDSFYLNKRNINTGNYNPNEKYEFDSWSFCFNEAIKKRYESLHEDLLYSNEKQDFSKAIDAFNRISKILWSIDE